jgi:hypothetical protein
LSGVDGKFREAFSRIEIINANQRISPSAFGVAVFRSECFGDGV